MRRKKEEIGIKKPLDKARGKRGLSRVRALAMVRARWLKRHRYDLVEVVGV